MSSAVSVSSRIKLAGRTWNAFVATEAQLLPLLCKQHYNQIGVYILLWDILNYASSRSKGINFCMANSSSHERSLLEETLVQLVASSNPSPCGKNPMHIYVQTKLLISQLIRTSQWVILRTTVRSSLHTSSSNSTYYSKKDRRKRSDVPQRGEKPDRPEISSGRRYILL